MLHLSEILGRNLGYTSFPNLYFPTIHDNLVDYLQKMETDKAFLESVARENLNIEDFKDKVANICTKVKRSVYYIEEEVTKNLENGKVPYLFNASEVFEMEIDSLITKVKDNDTRNDLCFDALESLSNVFNEDNVFLTQPYEDNFYMLDSNSKIDELVNYFIDEKSLGEVATPRFKDISVVVRQFDLDKAIENVQHREWVVKDPLALKEDLAYLTPREFFNYPGIGESVVDGEVSIHKEYRDWVLEMPSMPYIAEDVRPQYTQFIDIYGRRFCCEDTNCESNGKITWINNIQINLDNYGRPYTFSSYHDNRMSENEKNMYSDIFKYADQQSSNSSHAHGVLGLYKDIINSQEDKLTDEFVEESKRYHKNAEAEAVRFYLSNQIITHAVLGGLFRVTQWLNGEKDGIFVREDISVPRQERKRIKRSKMGSNTESDEPTVTIKTLKVKPSLYVVESDGTERPLRTSELAQHTRRGHWAHYGINGNGLFLGKYIKSMYRKPSTVGKIENGLIIKDYELEGRDSVDV